MSIYSLHWYIGHANGKTIQDIGEFMNQYVSRSSILVHYVVLKFPFVDFGHFSVCVTLTQMDNLVFPFSVCVPTSVHIRDSLCSHRSMSVT